MKAKVLNFIKDNKLLNFGDSVICAVSGGADSVCMLHILTELKEELSLKLYVAHLNHCLRGKDADRDEKFVENLSKCYGLPFYSKKVDVNALSQNLKLSCEEAGRKARYDFFNELKSTLKADKIATAHNADDNIETVLMRLVRGTDLKGLSGIPTFNDLDVIRPVLCLKRQEIEEYIKCKGLDFVTDKTNFENDFSRNKMRNIVIPALKKEFNESFADVFLNEIENFNEANEYIEKNVDSIFEKIANIHRGYISYDISSLINQDKYIAKRLIKKAVYELTEKSITTKLCNTIYDSLSSDTQISINENLDCYIKYDKVFFALNKDFTEFSYEIANSGTYNISECGISVTVEYTSENPIFSDKNVIFINPDKLSFPFLVRSRKNGDKIKLYNCGFKKIKDVFIDEKIPQFLRDYIPVFEKDNEIFWLAGTRDNVSYRAVDNKKNIKITIHKEN